MKIAVIGAAGQLGRAICPLLKGDIVAVTRPKSDTGTTSNAAGSVSDGGGGAAVARSKSHPGATNNTDNGAGSVSDGGGAAVTRSKSHPGATNNTDNGAGSVSDGGGAAVTRSESHRGATDNTDNGAGSVSDEGGAAVARSKSHPGATDNTDNGAGSVSDGVDVVAVTRSEFDLTHPEALQRALAAIQPQIVINCAAYNLVDKAETEPETAFAVNAWAVRNLALACRSLDATLVHVSTDYVFGLDSSRRHPWKETDAPGPVSAYGLSKLMGEYWARQIAPKHIVVRTCGLYGQRGAGGKGGNFVEAMLRKAAEGGSISVVADQRCTPSFAADVALAMTQLITIGKPGLYHVTNSGDCSWYEFAAEIFRQAGLKPDLKPIASADYMAAAKRPLYSVLARENADAIGLPQPRPWQEALGEYLRSRNQ